MAAIGRAVLPKIIVIAASSGLVAAWLLAVELAVLQGTFPVGWILTAPIDPELQSFTVAIVLSASLLATAWYRREGHRVLVHGVSLRWYLKTVAWGLLCAWLSAMLTVLPDALLQFTRAPTSSGMTPPWVAVWSMYGVVFGFPIVLVLSPIVVWVAEQVILRTR